MRLAVVLLGKRESWHDSLIEIIKEVAEAAINFYYENVEVDLKFLIPEPDLLDRERGQMDAEKVVSFISRHPSLRDYGIKIAFTNEDLFYDGLSFVFGIASRAEGVAVVSLFRLSRDYMLREFVPRHLLKERLFKETLHELGHLNGLSHCSNPSCVMSRSPTTVEVDEKLPMLCDECMEKLRREKRSS